MVGEYVGKSNIFNIFMKCYHCFITEEGGLSLFFVYLYVYLARYLSLYPFPLSLSLDTRLILIVTSAVFSIVNFHLPSKSEREL